MYVSYHTNFSQFLKVVSPPKVTGEELELARMTGAEIAAQKIEAQKAAARAEKEREKVDRREADRLRKIAEVEGDRLFAEVS